MFDQDKLAEINREKGTWKKTALQKTLDRFIDAEATLVARQLSAAAGKKNIWSAWRNIGSAMRNYGKQLVEGRFEEIKSSVAGL